MSAIEYIIMHCSDSEFGDVPTIRDWHLAKGWKDIGYHFVILNGRTRKWMLEPTRNGQVQEGRKLDGDNFISPDEVGAHTLGYNARSIGICLIGVADFTPAQMQSARALVTELVHTHGIPWENVLGHCETESGKAEGKTCPNMDMAWFRAYAKS